MKYKSIIPILKVEKLTGVGKVTYLMSRSIWETEIDAVYQEGRIISHQYSYHMTPSDGVKMF